MSATIAAEAATPARDTASMAPMNGPASLATGVDMVRGGFGGSERGGAYLAPPRSRAVT
jgi:hypothetical protein